MERRIHKRIAVNFEAEILSSGKVHQGQVLDVSEEGLGYLLSTRIEDVDDFFPEQIIRISFHLPTGETFSFNCDIRWLSWGGEDNRELNLGLKIIAPSTAYMEYIKEKLEARKS